MRFGRSREPAEDLDEGYYEGQGFPGSGGSINGDVLVAAEQGDGGSLDRRAELESCEG